MSSLDTVFLGNSRRRERVDQSQLLKKGGNGSAFRLNNDTVLKVFHEYNPTDVKKLEDMHAYFTQKERAGVRVMTEITRQQELAYDRNDQVVGFTMRYLSKDQRPMWEFTQPTYRTQFRVTPAMVARVFLAGIPVMNHIHNDLGMCIGDHNYRNTFHRLGSDQLLPEDLLSAVISQQEQGQSNWLLIDVDSFQFGRYGSEGDQFFLDPQLYGRNLNQPVFAPGNDWYSYAVMLHWCLTGGHPFGGGHRQYRNMDARMTNKVSVFDSSVIYPDDLMPLTDLGANLTKTLRSYFEDDNREPFPAEVLMEFIDWQEGRIRVQQPQAAKQPAKQAPAVNVAELQQLLKIQGYIMATVVEAGKVHITAVENGRVVYYLVDAQTGAQLKRMLLMPLNAGNRLSIFLGTNAFGATTPFIVIDPPFTDWLAIYEVTNTGVEKLTDVETGGYLAQDTSMFSTTRRQLIYMVHNDLFALSVERGRPVSRNLRSYRHNQTWFVADANSDTPSLVVGYNTINDTKYVYVQDQQEFPLPIESLGLTEVLEDVSAFFSTRHVMVVRRTKDRGRYFVRYEMSTTAGVLVYKSGRIPFDDPTQLFSRIQGRIYSRSRDGKLDMILHPTAEGIKQQRVQENTIRPFPLGQGVVNEGSQLYQIPVEGRLAILSVSEDAVFRIG